LVSSALALAIAGSESDRAIHLLQQALVRLAEPDLKMPDALPMLQALIAQISEKSASSDSERQLALSSIQDALTIWPDEPRWHDLAARILLLQVDEKSVTDQDPVLVHLERAAQLEPGLAEHHLKLGHYYIVHDYLEKAIQSVETATQVDPENSDAWLILAGLQKESGELEKATYSAERALAFASQSLEALLLRSQLALLTNNPRGALSRAQAILNITPDQAEAWFIVAQALDMLEKPADALVAIQKAILLTDDPLEYQRYRIDLLHRMNGAQAAIREIEQLSGTYPEDSLLLSMAAGFYLEINDSANAQKTARQALQFGQQELPETTQAQLHYIIGAQSRLAGQLDQAIYHLNEALRKKPDMMAAYLELGRSYQDRRQVNLALEIYQHAARLMPNDYRPYYQAGLALKESKDYLEAETMFRRAAHLAPNEVSIHRQLAAVVALNLVHNRRLASPE
jgi:tetratricopeptide (TPR) repeat protein